MSIALGPRTFATWTAAKRYLSDLVRQTSDGQRIAGDDEAVLLAALDLHPEAADKIGPGFAHFTAGPHETYPRTRCLYLRRVDGSAVAISFQNLRSTDEARARRDRLRALRWAIVPQIAVFAVDAFKGRATVICPIDGTEVCSHDCEVDHTAPATFAALVDAWLKTEGRSLGDLRLIPPPYEHCELADAEPLRAWQRYHREHAQLRIVSKSAHRRLTASHRPAP